MTELFLKPKQSVYLQAVTKSYLWFFCALGLFVITFSIPAIKPVDWSKLLGLTMMSVSFGFGLWAIYDYLRSHSVRISLNEDELVEYRAFRDLHIPWQEVYFVNYVGEDLFIYVHRKPTIMVEIENYGIDGRNKIMNYLRSLTKQHAFSLRWNGRRVTDEQDL